VFRRSGPRRDGIITPGQGNQCGRARPPRAFDVVVAAATGERLARHAQAFVDALGALGHDACLVRDRPPGHDAVPLLLAPSRTVRGLADAGHRDESWLSRAACLSLARPFSKELEEDIAILAESAAPFVAVPASARIVRTRNPRAAHLPFGYHPALTAWTPHEGSDPPRPVDVAFFGHGGGDRQRVLGRLADVLDPCMTDLRVSRLAEPIGVDQPRHLAASEVVLVLSDGAPTSGDWLDLVDAAANGAVPFVVDPGDLDPFEPAVHVAVAASRSVALSLPRLLANRKVLAGLRAAGRALVEARCSTITAAQTIARSTMSSGGRSSRQRMPPRPAAAPSEVRDGTPRVIVTPLPPTRAWPGESGEQYARLTPEISVVIPVHNGAGHVKGAIESAAASEAVRVEVIVVDDCSTDDTVDVVRPLITGAPILLLRRGSNGGVAAARNDGMAAMRAPVVFLLDADNRLLPHGLARLRAALEADPAAWFSYGIHVAVVDGEPAELRNTEPWSPELFRAGNYIDNAALVRRSSWERIGGFNEEQAAWEDYDRWLRVASLGGHGAYSPSIVMRYTVRHGSMSDTLSQDQRIDLRKRLAERYPAVLGGR
jgi:GT2 family glycosyltransferase